MAANRHQLTTVDDVLRYIDGGSGSFTIVSKPTGRRFTYKLSRPKRSPFPGIRPSTLPTFVRLLTRPDNANGYEYIGCLWDHRFTHGQKSRITADATGVKAIAWVMAHLAVGNLPDEIEFWHEGRCGRCGRKLTVPTSIEQGIGPICAQVAQAA